MFRFTLFVLFTLFIITVRSEEKDDGIVSISGKLNIYGENEEITDNAARAVESPLFELPSMKIAREYLRRQIQKERAQQKNE